MNEQYTVQTNDQHTGGQWLIYADDQGTIAGCYDNPDDVRGHICELGLKSVAMDVDGNGSMRQVPVEWIGDGEPLVGSERALQLIG